MNCKDCIVRKYPACGKGIPCCQCKDEDKEECCSCQPCPRIPSQMRAKDLKTGEWVHGWYVQLHEAIFDEKNEFTGKFEVHHAIFNDIKDRQGGYWTDIEPRTLEPWTE